MTLVEALSGFDPATLYEAAGKQGMVDPGIRPAWAGARLCGAALTVECPPADNLMLHVAVAEAEAGIVIVADAGGYLLAGAWGEILTEAARVRGVAGLAIDGAVRDVEAIASRRFPVFSRGAAIGACTKEKPGKVNVPIRFGGTIVNPGDVIVGDADGLVVIARDRAHEVYEAAVLRREREAEIMEELRRGRTTIEILGLTPPETGRVK
jgi:4-hydroxy-4-methyl-2-oxoglutarate aldolase